MVDAARAAALGLTLREQEVLAGMVEHGTAKAIGRALNISPRTVEIHGLSIKRKFGAETRIQAVVAAFRAGVLQ